MSDPASLANTAAAAAEPAQLNLVTADGARLALRRHGAQVVSWVPADGRERLYASARSLAAVAEADASGAARAVAVRGGIPVIFPQFSSYGPGPRHGFARDLAWHVEAAQPQPDGALVVVCRLDDTRVGHDRWPHRFRAEYRVRLAATRLSATLVVTNTDTAPFAFTAALHTYLAVQSLAALRIDGLGGLRYRDAAAGGAEGHEAPGPLAIVGEVDRLYFDTPATLTLDEPGARLQVEQSGFCDTVVWNPGAAKAASFADLDAGGEQRFVCVEAAIVGRPVQLAPGESWAGTQSLQV